MKKYNIKTLYSIVRLAWGRTPLFFIWGQPKENIDWIRMTVSKHYIAKWRNGKLKVVREVMRPMMFLMWPMRAFIISCDETRKYADKVNQITGKTKYQQRKEQFILIFTDQVSPEMYYLYQFYKDEVYDQAKYFINGAMASNLLAYLNNYISNDLLENKFQFEEKLRINEIPVVKSFALVQSGEIKFCNSEGLKNDLPEQDLLIKPLIGMLGRGIECFRFKDNNYVDMTGTIFDSDHLKKYLCDMSYGGDFLIQPLLRNHHLISDLGNGALSSVRILTAINIHGDIEVVIAVIKMARGKRIVDNYAAKGIASPINLDTGCIGPAVAKKPISPIFDNHPDSGGTITGRKLPFWNEIKEIVIKGHSLFQEFVFLGWDVAITSEGPKILETNDNWATELFQVPHHLPLGNHQFSSISVEWIKKRMEL